MLNCIYKIISALESMRNIHLVKWLILFRVNDHTQILKHIDLKFLILVDISNKVTDFDLKGA